MYERGGDIQKHTPAEYFDKDTTVMQASLEKWRAYLQSNEENLFLDVYSPDEQYIINTCPENRACPVLVSVVEELGEQAWGSFARLAVIEIPDDIQWEIDDYDGMERVEEVHRSWY